MLVYKDLTKYDKEQCPFPRIPEFFVLFDFRQVQSRPGRLPSTSEWPGLTPKQWTRMMSSQHWELSPWSEEEKIVKNYLLCRLMVK